jgi:hypothetical protein
MKGGGEFRPCDQPGFYPCPIVLLPYLHASLHLDPHLILTGGQQLRWPARRMRGFSQQPGRQWRVLSPWLSPLAQTIFWFFFHRDHLVCALSPETPFERHFIVTASLGKLRRIRAAASDDEQEEQTSGKKDRIEAIPSNNSRSGGPATARDPDQRAYSG